MIPSGPRTLGGTSFRQVVKAGKCGYRMAIFFRRMQMQISKAYWMQNEESACRRRRKRQCQRRRRIWRCGLRPSIPSLPARLVAVFAAHGATPSGAVFRAAACADPLHESALGYIQSYRAIFRVDPQILQVSFADERLELFKGIAGGEDGSEPLKGQALLRQREQHSRDAVCAGPAVCAAKNAKDRRRERGE